MSEERERSLESGIEEGREGQGGLLQTSGALPPRRDEPVVEIGLAGIQVHLIPGGYAGADITLADGYFAP